MPTPAQAAEELLRRRAARSSFSSWVSLCGFTPAKHHSIIIRVLQMMTDKTLPKDTGDFLHVLLRIKPDLDINKPLLKVMLLMPPGTAKSTYTSKLFPPWYLGRLPQNCILSCSYAKDLVQVFGKAARNYVDQYSNELGYSLRRDSTAADDWETTKGGRYFCAGTTAGIAGHRADFALLDDPIGAESDIKSEGFRKTLKDWYLNDFLPRLKPDAIQVIIANRRHEQDLVGMLTTSTKFGTDDYPNGIAGDRDEWLCLSFPFFCDSSNDPLGRAIGEPIWPEYFNETIISRVRKMPATTKAGLYQQKPTSETGDFFKREWLKGYQPEDLPPLRELKIYAASDHAISKRDAANKSCLGCGGVDSDGNLWILPTLVWDHLDSEEQIDSMIRLMREYKPITWRAEKGHITQSLGPFLRKQMRRTRTYCHIVEYTPKKDKQQRAQCIKGMMSMGMVFFPKFADWWPQAEHDLLAFDCGKDDDFIDFIAHLGNQIDQMATPTDEKLPEPEDFNNPHNVASLLTFSQLKESERWREHKQRILENA